MQRTKTTIAMAIIVLAMLSSITDAQQRIWRWDGENTNDFFGLSLSMPGDLDLDGRSDVIVGSGVSKTYVYSGGTGNTIFQLSTNPPDGLGWSVGSLGDLSADGIADFIVGASAYSSGSQGSYAGRALVYSGKDATVLFDLQGTYQNQFGTRVSGVGELDGDGVPDFLVVDQFTYYSPDTGKGRVYAYSGSSASLLYYLQGEKEYDGFGLSLAQVGDVDADGFGDFIVGARLDTAYQDQKGTAYLYSGHTGTLLFKWKGVSNWEWLGYSVSGAGDQDGDGVPDVLVGTVSTDRAFVYSGRTGGMIYELDGQVTDDGFGQAVADVGDVNGDGVHDLVVGAPSDSTLWKNAGRVDLFSGRTRRLLYSFPGDGTGSFFGFTLAGAGSNAGDVNGDGIPDFAVGTPSSYPIHPAGRVYVYAGNDLYLQASPPDPASGDTIVLDTRGGASGVFAMLVLTELNGTPTFTPILFSTLDSNGEWSVQVAVPPGLSGITIKLRSYALKSSSGGIVDSSDAKLSFQ